MAIGKIPVEAWTGTPNEVDFCPLMYPVRHIYFLGKEEVSEGIVFFCCSKRQKQRRPLRYLSLYLFFPPEGRLQNLLN
jgi:hypothetical protein